MTMWYPLQTKAFVDLGGKRRLVKVIKLNDKTAWCKIMFGAKSFKYIKRHRVKHNLLGYVRVDKTKGVSDETIHTTTED